jgi:hypothetical protein
VIPVRTAVGMPIIAGATVRTAIEDFKGRTVETTDERWGHIVERHP